MTSWWMAREYAISYGHLPGKAVARAKRLIDAELDKNFGQKTVGLKGSEIDIGVTPKKTLTRLRSAHAPGKLEQAKQTGNQASFS